MKPRRRTVALLSAERERQFEGVVDAARLFSHDVTAGYTYRDHHRRERVPAGIRALLVAMLEDALDLLVKYADFARRDLPEHRETHWRREYIEARRWIAATNSRHPFAFEAVCEALGLEPDGIRRVVLAQAPHIKPWSAPMIPRPKVECADRVKPLSQAVRAWTWALQQPGSWTVFALADALGCPQNSARGHISEWKRAGTVEAVGPPHAGRTRIGRYRVVGRAREVG